MDVRSFPSPQPAQCTQPARSSLPPQPPQPVKTTLCYLFRDGRCLMMLRDKKEHDANEGKWVGVGGKFLPGETPEACLRREVREETGFALAGFTFHGVVHFVSDTWDDEDMYLYSSSEFSLDGGADAPLPQRRSLPRSQPLPLPTCDEGTFAWIPVGEIGGLSLWEGDRRFLKRVLEGGTGVDMTLRYEGDALVSCEER